MRRPAFQFHLQFFMNCPKVNPLAKNDFWPLAKSRVALVGVSTSKDDSVFFALYLPGLGNQQLTLSLGGAASEPVVLTLLGQAKSFSWPKATFFQVRGIPRTEIFLNYSLLEKGDKHIQEVYK